MVSKKEIKEELLKLAKEYKVAGFGKLSDRLITASTLFKTKETIEAETDPQFVSVSKEEDKEEALEEPKEEEENSSKDEEEEEEESSSKEEEEEEEDAADDGTDIEDDVSAEEEEDPTDTEEEDASEDMQEEIALRDACTNLYRAARRLERHTSPKVRGISARLLKVERMIRSTL